MKGDFKKTYSFEERLAEGEKVREAHPDRVPIVVEPATKTAGVTFNMLRFGVNSDVSVSRFYAILKTRFKLKPEQALFVFVNDTIPSPSTTVGALYEEFHEEDMWLYMTCCEENVFG